MSLKPLSLCAPQPSSSVSVAPETAMQIDARGHGLGDAYVLTVPAEFAVHSGKLQYRGSTGVYHYIRRVSNWNMYYNKSSWGQHLDPLVYFIVSFKSDHLLKVCLRFPVPFRACCLAFKSSPCWPLSELERKKEWEKSIEKHVYVDYRRTVWSSLHTRIHIHIYIYIYINMYICILYIYIYTYIYMYIYVYVYMFTRICVCVCIYIYTYIRTYIRTQKSEVKESRPISSAMCSAAVLMWSALLLLTKPKTQN